MRNWHGFGGVFLAAVLVLAGPFGGAYGNDGGELYDPLAVYLTWQQDPTTTMTVHWHSFEPEGRGTEVHYRLAGADTWMVTGGEASPFPFSDPERVIHTVELTGLDSGSHYEFRLGEDTAVYRFKTMAATLDEPVRFAAGGDLHYDWETFGKMNRVVAKWNVDFAVFGGDLAYANGDPRLVERWYTFFDVAKETMVTPDGRFVPMLFGIGNHETFSMHRLEEGQEHLAEEWGLEQGDAPFFMSLFAFPGPPAYGVLDFGDYLSVILLTTGHYSPVYREQTEWLEGVLSARRGVEHVFPVYHVPAYPSVRNFRDGTNHQIRMRWSPLFEEHGVRIAFENHDHAYKRTHPLRGGEIHPDGVVYLGDGAWGVGVREPSVRDGAEDWFLVKAEPINHAYVVTLYPGQRHILAVDNEGNVFDELYQREK